MPGWTQTHPSRAAFVADDSAMVSHGTGVQIDWANVDAAYLDAVTGKKVLPAGTRLGLLLGAGKASPRVDTTNPAVGLLKTPAVQDDLSAPGGGMYGLWVGGPVYENLLPGAAGSPLVIDADEKAEMAAAGATFYFQQYGDTP